MKERADARADRPNEPPNEAPPTVPARPKNHLLPVLAAILFLSAAAREQSRRSLSTGFQSIGEICRADAERRLDLNRASIDELVVLPAIGPALARRIVEWRNLFGPFDDPSDLARVPGISPEFAATLARFVTTRPCPR